MNYSYLCSKNCEMLEFKDASLTINGHQLFSKLSLMAQDGQMTCITGPTGSGKTAMAQVMLGFMLLDEGLVSIDGELLTPLSAPTFRKTMAYLPQKHSVSLSPVEVNTMGLETIWSPFNNRNYHPSVIDEHLDVAPMASKAIIIADDPPSSLLSVLKSMATGNHTVIVMSCEENYINLSDKLITIGE